MKVLHLEGKEVFGSIKRKLDLSLGSEHDSHRYDKVNYSRSKVHTHSTLAHTDAGSFDVTPLSTKIPPSNTKSPICPHATSIQEIEYNP